MLRTVETRLATVFWANKICLSLGAIELPEKEHPQLGEAGRLSLIADILKVLCDPYHAGSNSDSALAPEEMKTFRGRDGENSKAASQREFSSRTVKKNCL